MGPIVTTLSDNVTEDNFAQLLKVGVTADRMVADAKLEQPGKIMPPNDDTLAGIVIVSKAEQP